MGMSQNFNMMLDECKSSNDNTQMKLDGFVTSSKHILDELNDLTGGHSSKILALEEASMQHFERAQHIRLLNTRVNQMDELRQQSEALAKDEVDATLSRNSSIINQFKTDIENKLQNINITYENNVESLIAEQKSFSKELNAIRANLNETINGINSETANLSKHLNNFENGINDKVIEINVCQNKALNELKNNIGEQMSSIGVETKKQFEA